MSKSKRKKTDELNEPAAVSHPDDPFFQELIQKLSKTHKGELETDLPLREQDSSMIKIKQLIKLELSKRAEWHSFMAEAKDKMKAKKTRDRMGRGSLEELDFEHRSELVLEHFTDCLDFLIDLDALKKKMTDPRIVDFDIQSLVAEFLEVVPEPPSNQTLIKRIVDVIPGIPEPPPVISSVENWPRWYRVKVAAIGLSGFIRSYHGVFLEAVAQACVTYKRSETSQSSVPPREKPRRGQQADPKFDPREHGGKELCIVVSYYKAKQRDPYQLAKLLAHKAGIKYERKYLDPLDWILKKRKGFIQHTYKLRKKAKVQNWWNDISSTYYLKYASP